MIPALVLGAGILGCSKDSLDTKIPQELSSMTTTATEFRDEGRAGVVYTHMGDVLYRQRFSDYSLSDAKVIASFDESCTVFFSDRADSLSDIIVITYEWMNHLRQERLPNLGNGIFGPLTFVSEMRPMI